MKIEKKLFCFKRSHRQRAGNGFDIKEKISSLLSIRPIVESIGEKRVAEKINSIHGRLINLKQIMVCAVFAGSCNKQCHIYYQIQKAMFAIAKNLSAVCFKNGYHHCNN